VTSPGECLEISRSGLSQPTLGIEDKTDYDNDVFDPGDCDDMDDAM
jgi:hypothetical protein